MLCDEVRDQEAATENDGIKQQQNRLGLKHGNRPNLGHRHRLSLKQNGSECDPETHPRLALCMLPCQG